MNILDLDKLKSINDYYKINTTNKFHTIYVLGNLIREFGTKINQTTYTLYVRYLGHNIPLTFIFDAHSQFIDIKYEIFELKDTKCGLYICLAYNDDPIIKWIESHPGVPTYLSTGRGEYLMNFAHCFLHFIGFTRVRLDDDSYLTISTTIKLKLWLYLLLLTGRSWYSKFGYVPTTPLLEYQLLISDIKSIKLNEISIVENSTQTLEEYIKSHSIEESAILLNTIFQSTFKSFFWYEIYDKLLIANICQVNDTIDNFVRLSD